MKTEHEAILLGLAAHWRKSAANIRKHTKTKKQRDAIGETKHFCEAQIIALEDRADELEKHVAGCV